MWAADVRAGSGEDEGHDQGRQEERRHDRRRDGGDRELARHLRRPGTFEHPAMGGNQGARDLPRSAARFIFLGQVKNFRNHPRRDRGSERRTSVVTLRDYNNYYF